MVILEVKDRNRLLDVLKGIELLLTYKGRVQALRSADLKSLESMIELEGEPRLVIAELVDKLANYGRISQEREALGQFINVIKQEFGAGETERIEILDHLLIKYQMMTPVAKYPDRVKWNINLDENIQEKIIGENTLRPIVFLKRGLEIANAVALVLIPGVRSGTGFLFSSNLLITNCHVLPNIQDAQAAIFRFNYQNDINGKPEPYYDYHMAKDGCFYTNKNLDYSIIELDNCPGDKWGFISMKPHFIESNHRVNIIQHSAGMPKQISFQNNFVSYVDQTIIQYVTTTLPGSSGSPVLNDQWKLVAVHHAGGFLQEPRTGNHYYRNEGIVINAILEDIPSFISERMGNK